MEKKGGKQSRRTKIIERKIIKMLGKEVRGKE